MAPDTPVIRAAGAVLWRYSASKKIEIALVHRPRYDDWSLPKGKVEEKESHIACAYREVLEETGYASIFGPQIGQAMYKVPEGKKVVRYWSAQAVGEPVGTIDKNEIDEILWLEVKEARKKLTLDDDKAIVDFFVEFGVQTTPLVLLRHAKALKRDEWDGEDSDRPLDNLGQLQAKRLLPQFYPYSISEIHSSDAYRCMQTVEDLTRALELNTIIGLDLSEDMYSKDKEAALDYVSTLMQQGNRAVICSHNPILPKVLKKLVGKKYFKELDSKLEPAEAWVIHHRDGEVVSVDWVEAPQI
jgi:phosphohistidine phosphatase SixA/ADP-ribose pyrophosphatase YjhB (NUDIX family)